MLQPISTKWASLAEMEPSIGIAARGQPIAFTGMNESNPVFSAQELEEIFKILILSPRQKEIVTLILQGLRDRQIAEQLHIKNDTIHVHMKHLFTKCKINSRTQLILIIVRAFRMKYQAWVMGDNTYLLEDRTRATERKVHELLDEVWPAFTAILPPVEGHIDKRQPASNRDCLHALLYVTALGISWRQLPKWLPGYYTVLRRRKIWMKQDNFRAAWSRTYLTCRKLRIMNHHGYRKNRFPSRDPGPVKGPMWTTALATALSDR